MTWSIRSTTKAFCSPEYWAAAYEFDSTRKARWLLESLESEPLPGVEIVPPPPLGEHEIAAAHDPRYVAAIRTGDPRDLAETNCFSWDPGVWTMALAHTSGVVAAARQALCDGVSGSFSTGCHHARRDSGKGFCTFNGLAIAARAIAAETAKPVLIVDLDAHCGGGTASLVRDDPAIWQVDVSTSNFDMYGDSDRCEVDIIGDAAAYLPKVVERLRRLDATGVDFALCIYFSGMDPHEGCAFGGRAGITEKVLEERERVVFGWAASRQLPVAFSLGGGYSGAALSRDRLVALHRLTLAVALEYQGGQCDVQSEIRDGSRTAAKSTSSS